MKFFARLPYWIRGCVFGNLLGSVLFLAFVALFTLTPLYLIVAVFTASGAAGADMFAGLALTAALVGAWAGGLFGMPIGALVGRASKRRDIVWSTPGWLTGALVTAYMGLPTFLDPTTSTANEPAVMQVVVFAIMAALGALVGYIVSCIGRLFRQRA
jgi:hypothetical protein